MTTISYTYKFEGGELNCTLDFQPEEPATRHCPGEPAATELGPVRHKGVDIYDLLDPKLKTVIETKALKAHLADLKDRADDARIEAYRDRTERSWGYA